MESQNPEPNGSFAVLLNKNGEMLLLRDMRTPSKFNLPGGGMGMGELPVDAAVRETFEESGREIFRESLKQVGVYVTRKKYGVVFLYTSTEPLPKEHPPHSCHEVSERAWVLPQNVLKMSDSEIYPAQRTLVRYYLQWARDGEKIGDVGHLSPPFEMKGKYFDTL